MSKKYGEAITIANSEDEKEKILSKYIKGKPEEITSKLAVEPVLRSSILGLIASEVISNKKQLIDFFGSTFYGFQYKDTSGLHNKLKRILEQLHKYDFIKLEEDKFKATILGKRISQLYLDPESAWVLLRGLKRASLNVGVFSLLHLISYTIDMNPLPFKGAEWDEINEEVVKNEKKFLLNIPQEWDPEYDFFLSSVKTALVFEDWINEKSEEYILEKYKLRPGALYAKLKNADWLLYASQEISRILSLKSLQAPIRKTRLRVKYGIKENLLPLVKLKNIGRVRARRLIDLGVNNLGDLKKIPVNKLSKAVGKKVAVSLKEQVGIKIDPKNVRIHRKGQQELGSF